jgi:molybdopterin synthase sulfur carrier subunit
MGTIKVCFFAHLKERAGQQEVILEIGGPSSVQQMRAGMEEAIPSLKGMTKRCRIAVNQEFVGEEAVIHAGDEIAFLPPFSGG